MNRNIDEFYYKILKYLEVYMDTPKMPETISTHENLSQSVSWIKKNILLIILFVLLLIFVITKLSKFESTLTESIILSNASLDFQNKSGADRIKSSFTDILVASDGSIKKGDGYELKLKIINPSTVTLHNIRCEFRYSSSQMPVIYEDINMSILPGNSKVLTCFISDLSDYDLKTIDVSVKFDHISFYQQ